MRKFFIPVLAAAALAVPAAPAPAAETFTALVTFADLDIATPEGRQTLERRIAEAVTEVCGRPGPRSSLAGDMSHRCRADARADALAQLEAHLAARHVEIAVVD